MKTLKVLKMEPPKCYESRQIWINRHMRHSPETELKTQYFLRTVFACKRDFQNSEHNIFACDSRL